MHTNTIGQRRTISIANSSKKNSLKQAIYKVIITLQMYNNEIGFAAFPCYKSREGTTENVCLFTFRLSFHLKRSSFRTRRAHLHFVTLATLAMWASFRLDCLQHRTRGIQFSYLKTCVLKLTRPLLNFSCKVNHQSHTPLGQGPAKTSSMSWQLAIRMYKISLAKRKKKQSESKPKAKQKQHKSKTRGGNIRGRNQL